MGGKARGIITPVGGSTWEGKGGTGFSIQERVEGGKGRGRRERLVLGRLHFPPGC